MKRISVSGTIQHYNPETGEFKGFVETKHRHVFQAMYNFVGEAQWAMLFGKLYKGRTTGGKSQNHHYWGHLQQISEATGNDIDALDELLRYKAISMGYPFEIIDGWKVPHSERFVNTKEYAILIEMVHWFASDEAVELYEGEE